MESSNCEFFEMLNINVVLAQAMAEGQLRLEAKTARQDGCMPHAGRLRQAEPPTCVLQHLLQHGHKARERKLLVVLVAVPVLHTDKHRASERRCAADNTGHSTAEHSSVPLFILCKAPLRTCKCAGKCYLLPVPSELKNNILPGAWPTRQAICRAALLATSWGYWGGGLQLW